MHLNAPLVFIISGLVREVPQREVAAKLAIDAGQQIEVECGGNTGGIIVGLQEVGHRLLQVGAKYQRIAGQQPLPDLAQEVLGRRTIEVADRAPQKQHQKRLPHPATGGHFAQAIQIGFLQSHDAD